MGRASGALSTSHTKGKSIWPERKERALLGRQNESRVDFFFFLIHRYTISDFRAGRSHEVDALTTWWVVWRSLGVDLWSAQEAVSCFAPGENHCLRSEQVWG